MPLYLILIPLIALPFGGLLYEQVYPATQRAKATHTISSGHPAQPQTPPVACPKNEEDCE